MGLIFNVKGQSLERLDTFKPATDSVEYLTVAFTFSDDWGGTAKTAKFRKDDLVYPANINSSGVCVVPWEVLVRDTVNRTLGKQYFYMTLEGVNGTRKITTAEVAIEIIPSGKGETTTPSTPTPDVYAQYVEDVKAQTGADVKSAHQSAETAIAYAEQAEESARSLKNDYSNALKGYASGSVVRVDDVSPVEHYPRVKVHGKNIFNPEIIDSSYEANGLTITRNGDEITINGTSTKAHSCPVIDMFQPINKGKTYTCTVYRISGSGDAIVASFGLGTKMSVRDEFYDCTSVMGNISDYRTFTANYDHLTRFLLYFQSGATFNNLVCKIQLEENNVSTAYTPYIDPSTVTITDGDGNTYTPDADGTVEGIVSTTLSGGLSTDTENTYIDVEYNRDINVVIADILAKLS